MQVFINLGDPTVLLMMGVEQRREIRLDGIDKETTVDAMNCNSLRAIGENSFRRVDDRADVTGNSDFLFGLAVGGCFHHFAFKNPTTRHPPLALSGSIFAAHEQNTSLGNNRHIHAGNWDIFENLVVQFLGDHLRLELWEHGFQSIETVMETDHNQGWRTLSQETLAENPYWSYLRDHYTLRDGQLGTYYYVHTPGSVIVVPLIDAKTVLLVRQYRYLNRRESLEFPGGGQKIDQSALAAAQAELQEETSYTAKQWQPLGTFNPCKGITDELSSVFLATDLDCIPRTVEDPFEVTEVERYSLGDMDGLIAKGEIWCGMTIAAWCMARNRLEFRE
jgi:ADP-ribose pyrophosphatase